MAVDFCDFAFDDEEQLAIIIENINAAKAKFLIGLPRYYFCSFNTAILTAKRTK